mgnify:CR=1 FL=1|jgi:hypothetical protein
MTDETKTPEGEGTTPSAVEAAAAAAAEGGALASIDPNAPPEGEEDGGNEFDVSTLGEQFVTDGKPNMQAIADALGKVAADVPAEDGEYDLSFGEDFDLKGEDGEVVKVDPADPIVADMTAWARANNVGQEAVSGLMGIYGKIIKQSYDVNSEAVVERQTAEWKKLADDGDVDKAKERANKAASGLFQALGKEKSAQSMAFINAMNSAPLVEFAEAILERLGDEGSASPTNETNGDGRKSDASVFFDNPTSRPGAKA